MADWKGTKVCIDIYDAGGDVFIHKQDVYLDTDTMADLYDKYPPGSHTYVIQPVTSEE